jgi:hypothetical protein
MEDYTNLIEDENERGEDPGGLARVIEGCLVGGMILGGCIASRGSNSGNPLIEYWLGVGTQLGFGSLLLAQITYFKIGYK